MLVELLIDNRSVRASSDETILQIAKKLEISIPYLCFKDGYRPDGNCRSCVVEIKGERTLAPSCCRHPENGMIVNTNTERTRFNQKMILELLESDLGEEVSSNGDGKSEL